MQKLIFRKNLILLMENKSININELRIKIDQLNQKIISGLKDRSRFAANLNTFKKEFNNGLTWFEYRLKKEQDLDSEFGRFMYYDQQPFLFSKKELSSSKVKSPINKGYKPLDIDLSKKILSLHKNTLTNLCENKEDLSTYGETVKLDVDIILTLNERTVGIGEQVAAYKLDEEPELFELKTAKEIRKKLIKPEREKDVINKTADLCKKYEIKNINLMKKFAKDLIEITLDAEVHFILNSNKKK